MSQLSPTLKCITKNKFSKLEKKSAIIDGDEFGSMIFVDIVPFSETPSTKIRQRSPGLIFDTNLLKTLANVFSTKALYN